MQHEGNEYENIEQDIQHSADICRTRFIEILALVNQDEAVIRRTPLLFEQPPGTRPILTILDLRDEFEQFRIWTNNLGVFASDHACLDYRLRDALDVKEGVVSLLKSLFADLAEVSTLLKEDRRYEHEDPHSESNPDEEADSDDETDLLTDLQLTALELQNHIDHISDIVTKLIHLGSAIRVSGVRSRTTKAANYVHYEDGVNQTEIFEQVYLPTVLKHRFQITEPLLSRLCKAISSRRRLFMYQRKHQKRLAYDAKHLQEEDLFVLASLPTNKLDSYQEVSRATLDSPLPVSSVCKEGDSATIAPTLATTFRPNNLKRCAPSTMVASTANLAMSGIDFPPPPPIADNATHFVCPYCCLLVEERKRAPGRWQKHVLYDLQPFLCIDTACTDPHVILETRSDWVEHQRWAHAMEWWCEGFEPDHAPQRFQDPKDYSDHLLNDHMAGLSLRDVSRMVNVGGGPSQEPFKVCPFCAYKPSNAGLTLAEESQDTLQSAKTDQTRLQNHIFDHLLSMFMLALPDRDDIEESKSEVDSSNISRGYSTPRALSRETEQSAVPRSSPSLLSVSTFNASKSEASIVMDTASKGQQYGEREGAVQPDHELQELSDQIQQPTESGIGRPGQRLRLMDLDSNSNRPARRKERLYPCTFHHFGCPASFASKFEWKRHVKFQHLQLGFFRCDLGSCQMSATTGRGNNDFNRRDLFNQHCRRMHSPLSASLTRQADVPEIDRENFDKELDVISARCWIARRKAPEKSNCGFCGKSFEDSTSTNSWENRMEHVGRHYESGHHGPEDERVDDDLLKWAVDTGVVVAGKKNGTWLLASFNREDVSLTQGMEEDGDREAEDAKDDGKARERDSDKDSAQERDKSEEAMPKSRISETTGTGSSDDKDTRFKAEVVERADTCSEIVTGKAIEGADTTEPRFVDRVRSPVRYRPEDLEAWKPLIERMYLEDGISVRNIRDNLEIHHGIVLSTEQLRTMMAKWVMERHLSLRDAAFSLRMLNQARSLKQPEVVIFCGRELNKEDIERYIRSHSVEDEAALLARISDDDPTPAYIHFPTETLAT